MPKFTPTQQTMLLEAAAFYQENTNLTPFEAAILNRAMDKLLHGGHTSSNENWSAALRRWLEERGL